MEALGNLVSKLFKFYDSLTPLAMQRSLLHYGRAVPKAALPAGAEEIARRSALQRAELARLGLDVSSKKRSVGRPNRQLLYEQTLTKALQNDADCLTGHRTAHSKQILDVQPPPQHRPDVQSRHSKRPRKGLDR
eukprot:1734579-Amphidinium_carterae.1